MQQKMRSTVIKLKNEDYIQFHKIISYNKFGYNALFTLVQFSNIVETINNKNNQNLIIREQNHNDQFNQKINENDKIYDNNKKNKKRYFDVYAFSKSLLQINNLKTQIQDQIKQYQTLNSKVLSPIIDRVQDKDMFYLISHAYEYSLKELVQLRQGLTQYEVIYFTMQIFEIMNYYKSRKLYLQKVDLDNFYLNQNMKLVMTFNLFLNNIVNKPLIKRLPFRKETKNLNNCPDLFESQPVKENKLNQKYNSNNTFIKSRVYEKQKDKDKSNIQSQNKHEVINSNLVNSWNLGVLLYQIFQNKKPFPLNCDLVHYSGHVAHQNKNKTTSVHSPNIKKQQDIPSYLYQIHFYHTESIQSKDLISSLLQIDSKKRLNLSLVVIQPLFKKLQQIPHILPSTIVKCPPSEEYKQSFKQKFSLQTSKLRKQSESSDNLRRNMNLSPKPSQNKKLMKSQSSQVLEYNGNKLKKHKLSIRYENNPQDLKAILHEQDQNKQDDQSQNSISINQNQPQQNHVAPKIFTPVYQTQKYIKNSQRNLNQNKIYIEQFADISHIYGYGYQMNTGMMCFVFNDETQFYYPNANRKILVYVNQKKIKITYNSQKLPEQDQLKKKIFILQGYSKTIKKYKSQSNNEKVVSVLRYAKTKHASIFYLSNDTIQLFFNDKISFLVTKNVFYVLGKNNDKYEKYDYKNQTSEMKTRLNYVISMAEKIFGWKNDKLLEDQDINGDNEIKQIKQSQQSIILNDLDEQTQRNNPKVSLNSFKKKKNSIKNENKMRRPAFQIQKEQSNIQIFVEQDQ